MRAKVVCNICNMDLWGPRDLEEDVRPDYHMSFAHEPLNVHLCQNCYLAIPGALRRHDDKLVAAIGLTLHRANYLKAPFNLDREEYIVYLGTHSGNSGFVVLEGGVWNFRTRQMAGECKLPAQAVDKMLDFIPSGSVAWQIKDGHVVTKYGFSRIWSAVPVARPS